MMHRFRRRRYLVHTVQYHLLMAVMVYFLAALTGVVAVVFGPLVLDFSGGSTYTMEKYEAAGVFLRLHQQFWPVVLLLIVLVVLHSILVSHRIGGPLYRFRTVFKAVGQGDLSMSVRLRRHDYVKAEAEELDQMIASLRNHVQRAQSSCASLADAAQSLRTEDPAWKHFDQQLETLQTSLEVFHVRSATGREPTEAPLLKPSVSAASPADDGV
jgi:methyl-accepting chemotaxis protein